MSGVGQSRKSARLNDMSVLPTDGVIGRPSLWIAERFWVLRFRLMVKTRSVVDGLKHQKEKRSMDHFGGLDVSVKETQHLHCG